MTQRTAAYARTVSGDIAVSELGLTLMHEHVVTHSPGIAQSYPETYPREDVSQRCSRELAALRTQYGLGTIVDHSTVELGRDVEMLADVARSAGIAIIACTGVWAQPSMHFAHRSPEYAAKLFIRDIQEGVAGTAIRAGIVKCGVDSEGFTRGVCTGISAAALTHHATGVPISVHTWTGNHSGLDVAERLIADGIDMRHVVLGHSGDTEDLAYLRALLDTGAYLGMDRFGIEDRLPDSARVRTVVELCREGFSSQLLLSHDASCWSGRLSDEYKRSTRPNWHLRRIFEYVLPELERGGITESVIEEMLVRNPRTLFAGDLSGDVDVYINEVRGAA